MIEDNFKYAHKLENYTFIDLFCGLGGFRLALESFGAKCVFSSDIDPHVSKVYEKNFGDDPLSDLTLVDEKDIPPHDILCAGFPCQAFSISGKQRGFEDTRGTLFREVVRIARFHHPKLLLLENVKNLEHHDNGRTFRVIRENIEAAGYNMYWKVLDASDYGVPQARQRLYMVCIRTDLDNHSFVFPNPIEPKKCLMDVLLTDDNYRDYNDCSDCIVNMYFNLSDVRVRQDVATVFDRPVRIGTVKKGGQGDRIYDPRGQAITLSAEGGGTGARTGLYYVNNRLRKLHPRECARLMGFPEWYKIDSSKNQARKQFGNSVVVDVLQYIIKNIIDGECLENGE